MDDKAYRHENILYFYMSWIDPGAANIILEATNKSREGKGCSKPCVSGDPDGYCCDGLFLPSFDLRNTYRIPQDNMVQYEIFWVGPVAAMATYVHAEYYQASGQPLVARACKLRCKGPRRHTF